MGPKEMRERVKTMPPTSDEWDNATQDWALALWHLEVDDMTEDQIIDAFTRLQAQGRFGR